MAWLEVWETSVETGSLELLVGEFKDMQEMARLTRQKKKVIEEARII